VKILLSTGYTPPNPPRALTAQEKRYPRGQDVQVFALLDNGMCERISNVLSLSVKCDGRNETVQVTLVLTGVELELVGELRAVDAQERLGGDGQDVLRPKP